MRRVGLMGNKKLKGEWGGGGVHVCLVGKKGSNIYGISSRCIAK
jgi:hypothetical protein